MTDYRTTRKKALGLGASHHGAGTWIKERVSAILLIPLTLWGLWAGYEIALGGYGGAVAWLQSPMNAVLLALLLVVGIYHMHLGMRVVLEDYIHKPSSKAVVLLLNFAVCVVLAAVAVFAVLKVALGGGYGTI